MRQHVSHVTSTISSCQPDLTELGVRVMTSLPPREWGREGGLSLSHRPSHVELGPGSSRLVKEIFYTQGKVLILGCNMSVESALKCPFRWSVLVLWEGLGGWFRPTLQPFPV